MGMKNNTYPKSYCAATALPAHAPGIGTFIFLPLNKWAGK